MLQLTGESSSVFWKRSQMYHPSVGEELEIVKQDHCVKTHPANNHNRRTLILQKQNGAWGFTIQSYGVQHKTQSAIEHLTYVDYIELGGAAYVAGLRKGDIILSINGHSMENMNHHQLVNFIKSCGQNIRMVVLFEDCTNKVELHLRYIKLTKLLAAKEFELKSINNTLSCLQRGVSPNQKSCSTANLGSLEQPWIISPEVNALATLPRRPKPIGTRAKMMAHENSGFLAPRPMPRSLSAGNSSNSDVSIEYPSTSSVHSAKSDSILDKNMYKCNSGLMSEDCGLGMLPHDPLEHYNSLPVRGCKKRHTLLTIPLITITPPTLSRGRSYQEVSSPTISLRSFGSLSSRSSSTVDLSQPTTPDTDPSSPANYSAQIRSVLQRSRSSLRSRSFRAPSRGSISPAAGPPYIGSSNHVLTEHNSRVHSDPELLRLKQGNMDLHSPDRISHSKSTSNLFRSLSSPAMRMMSAIDETRKRISLRKSPDREMRKRLKSDENHDNQVQQEIDYLETRSGEMDVDTERISERNMPVGGGDSTNQRSEVRSRDTNMMISERVTNQMSVLSVEDYRKQPVTLTLDLPKITPRCWSMESDMTGSFSRSSSLTSDHSHRSSGSFEYYSDPFSPLTDNLPMFIPKPNDTPVMSRHILKRPRRILSYCRHTDIVKQDIRLMNINEEEECTRL